MSVYSTEHRLGGNDVNMFRRLRTSVMFELMQDVSEQQNVLHGLDSASIRERGLFWAVIRQCAAVSRMPGYGERITLETWPGKPRHMLFPRYFRLLDSSGDVLVSVSSVWTLVDIESRKMVSPEKYGIQAAYEITGNELPLPRPPEPVRDGDEVLFTVPFSYADINGHKNNTRYFDLAEDGSSAAAAGKQLSEILVEYSAEAHIGDEIVLCRSEGEGRYTVSGSEDGRKLFTVSLRYRE